MPWAVSGRSWGTDGGAESDSACAGAEDPALRDAGGSGGPGNTACGSTSGDAGHTASWNQSTDADGFPPADDAGLPADQHPTDLRRAAAPAAPGGTQEG